MGWSPVTSNCPVRAFMPGYYANAYIATKQPNPTIMVGSAFILSTSQVAAVCLIVAPDGIRAPIEVHV